MNLPAEIATIDGLVRWTVGHPISGIYFLCIEGRIEYVGRTSNMDNRMKPRRNFGYDAFIVPVPMCEQADIERHWIRRLTPRRNKALRNAWLK